MIYFISGGVRSGKSNFAEKLALSLKQSRLIYLATAKEVDDEMEIRIKKHREDRADKQFLTIECEKNLNLIFTELVKDDTVLLECLTTLVANEMFDNNLDSTTVEKKVVDNIFNLHQHVRHVVVVSNDLYGDDLIYSSHIEEYRKILTKISCKIVEQAQAYEVVNGYAFLRRSHVE